MPRVALVTCRDIPEPDHDEDLLLAALRGAGLQAAMLAWDDSDADPGAFDLCVLRSCWNYYEDTDTFLAWCHRAATSSRLLNEVGVVRWNLHKGYLKQLDDAGVAILPTAWFERGESADLRETMQTRDWNDVVIKPAISASSFGTRRFQIDQMGEAQAFLDGSLVERDMMVQQYMPAVESSGERAIVWIDGEVTHAVTKSPRFAGGVEQVSAALEVSDRERAVVAKVLACVGEPLLYARVDLVKTDGGELLLSEVELMEPSLFFQQHPAALERFVAAVRRESAVAP